MGDERTGGLRETINEFFSAGSELRPTMSRLGASIVTKSTTKLVAS